MNGTREGDDEIAARPITLMKVAQLTCVCDPIALDERVKMNNFRVADEPKKLSRKRFGQNISGEISFLHRRHFHE
jgi:hypothetical protein